VMRTPAVPMLCDVNVLLALVTDRHAAHTAAVSWLGGVPAGDAAICRIAQTGLLRLLNNPAVMREDVLDTDACWGIWHRLLDDDRIRFTPTEPSGLDAVFERFTSGRVFTPRLWTDAYLASYAQVSGLVLVTFDQGFRQFDSLACHVLEAG
jgi:toxin-antitoxin system PIN domain toxin